jgi:hypothetical protein
MKYTYYNIPSGIILDELHNICEELNININGSIYLPEGDKWNIEIEGRKENLAFLAYLYKQYIGRIKAFNNEI